MRSVGKLVREYRDLRGMNQLALARALGLKSRGSIQNWEAGNEQVRVIYYPGLVKALGIPPLEIIEATPPQLREIAEGALIAAGLLYPTGEDKVRPGFGKAEKTRFTPVVGRCSGDPDANIVWDAAEGEEALDWTGCAALEVEGDSMTPIAWKGQHVIYHTDRDPRNGDLALVRLKGGETLFKRITFDRKRGTIICESVKPGNALRIIEDDQVEWVYKVIGVRFAR